MKLGRGLVVVVLVVLAAGWLSRQPAPVGAEGRAAYDSVALAGTPIRLWFAGTTTGAVDVLGDMIEFKADPAPGSLAVPRFPNGTNIVLVPLGGGPCQPQTEPDPTQLTRCFASAAVTSATPGTVTVTARNTVPGHGGWRFTVEFLPVAAIVPRVTGANAQYGLNTLFVQNAGAAPGEFHVAFYTSGGQLLTTLSTEDVPPGATRPLDLSRQEKLRDVVATAVVGGTQPVAVAAYHGQNRGGGFARSMANGLPYEPGGGRSTISIPYVANALERTYNTAITIANVGDTTACVRVTYTFVPGAGAVPPTGKPPVTHQNANNGTCPSGQFQVVPRDSVVIAPPPHGNAVAYPTETNNTLMSATLEVEGGRVGALVTAFTSDGTAKEAQYEAFRVSGFKQTDLSKDVVLPLALKTADGYYTQALFSNPNDAPADVTITYRGNTGPHTVTMTVPARGVANHSTYSDNIVPSGFVGAARIASTQPLAVVLFRAKKVNPQSEVDEPLYTAVNGLPADRASKTLYFPSAFRRLGQTPGRDGINSWISVTVPGGGTANLSVRAVGGCSTSADADDTVYQSTKQISGSFVFYQNADSDNGFPGGNSPACFAGGVMITSDVPILGVASYLNDLLAGDGEAVYSGLAGP